MSVPPLLLEAASAALKKLGVGPGVVLRGLPVESLPLILIYLFEKYRLPVLSSLLNLEDALILNDVLSSMSPNEGVHVLPYQAPLDTIPTGFGAPLEDMRFLALAALAGKELPKHLLFTRNTLSDGIPSSEALRHSMLSVRPGEVSYAALRSWLIDNAYDSTALVTEPGCFALRGSIIDCYPVNSPVPVRFDFLDDNLEEIRTFDIHSQSSTARLETVELISPAIDDSNKVPVFDHFPAGWILVRQDDPDQWSVTSSTVRDTASSVDLLIELFLSESPLTEHLSARWELLLNRNPESQAFFIGNRQAHYDQLTVKTPLIPLKYLPGDFSSGFSSIPLGLLVLTPAELTRRQAIVRRSARKQAASLTTIKQHIETLDIGDPVVHINYGIGRYLGLTNLEVSGVQQECLTIEYEGGDRVHVSTDMIGLVFPYTVSEGQQIQLDSLQSHRWERVKRRTRRSAEEVVDYLAELYALRASASGVSHVADNDLQAEFEESFTYEDTPDQQRATAEIKRDMERPNPMDRLLCGDVGFGKTELALRASFKAIIGGYQVALLAPTTILADQHFISFRARLEPFAIKVDMLSRFLTASNQRRVLEQLASGAVDLVVGTHRLLSSDVSFKRLGLLIIDEEQRFGVRQKERLKELRSNIDVLSLSATPIPRTLHFSLSGIREISRLDTPPRERIPIITSINYFNEKLITDAVLNELKRGGQVYFVHHEVKSIDRIAPLLQSILPGVSLAIAHGQLNPKELEATMLAFSDKRVQLLVCTSIIESGIDLPNVNTVIINNAHRFGLAQLYQIRGRVGRSNRQAYAFLLIPRRTKPSLVAHKRLKTIENYTALGSGYAIALKDLEIRGTGNLFGLEQSGHVAAVGLDLYTRIIQGVARERSLLPEGERTLTPLSREDVKVRIFPGAIIPEQYIPDSHMRLNIYRRLSLLDSHDDLESFRSELVDRFGSFPVGVEQLLKTVQFCISSMSVGARSTRLTADDSLLIDFIPPADPVLFLTRLRNLLEPTGYHYRFINLKNNYLRLSINTDGKDVDFIVEYLFKALEVHSN